MGEVKVQARIISTNDTQANWNQKPDFVPRRGQVIVYQPDDTHTAARVKIGDGTSFLIDLPFIAGGTDTQMADHIANTGIHVNATEKNTWNSKVTASVVDENLVLN